MTICLYYPLQRALQDIPCSKDCFSDAVAAYKSCLNSLMPWEREVLECEYGNIDVTEKEA